jgi:DNA-binding transcriptional LysR family regulator
MRSEGVVVNSLDWNDVRFFLAVARERTLARAAAALGVDQTTVGRRIAALETRLRVAVFERSASCFELTAAGRRILEAAERMNEASLDFAAQLLGDQAPCEGTVHVATTETLAEYFVVPAMRRLRASYPRLTVVLRTSWARVDLRKGEADLALRLVRPDDPRLACRKVAEFSLRLYASRAYITSYGMPDRLHDHALLGYEEAMRAGGSVFTGLAVEGGHIVLQANSGRVLVAAAVAGLGIAQLPSYVGETVPELVRVLPELDKAYGVWLVLLESKRRLAAVRAVSDAIAGAFRQSSDDPGP